MSNQRFYAGIGSRKTPPEIDQEIERIVDLCSLAGYTLRSGGADGADKMFEYLLSIKIEELEEGGYLATSNVLQGLVAQGRTIAETIEIAQDVARKLIESCIEHGDPLPFELRSQERRVKTFRIPVVVDDEIAFANR